VALPLLRNFGKNPLGIKSSFMSLLAIHKNIKLAI